MRSRTCERSRFLLLSHALATPVGRMRRSTKCSWSAPPLASSASHRCRSFPPARRLLQSSYDFQCYFVLLSIQMVVSLAFCSFTRDFLGNPFNVPRLTGDLMLSAAPMAILGVLNVGAGLM